MANTRLLPALLAVLVGTGIASAAHKKPMAKSEMDMMGSQTGAPVDFGYGPRQGGLWSPPQPSRETARTQNHVLGAVPPGGFNAAIQGAFDPPVSWPINGLHEVLLPDGRVMNYGTDQTGQQGAALVYDVWNPALGMGPNAHTVLSNTTATDIFCSAQTMIWQTGEVLITGGDMTMNGDRNYSNNKTTIFSPQTNTIRAASSMVFPRWYPALVAMPNGDYLVLGGRTAPNVAATTPEVFNPATGWRTLTGAASATAFSNTRNLWFYPRGFVARDGKVFLIDNGGHMWSITTRKAGTTTQLPQATLTTSEDFPTIMYAPDKLLSLRYGSAVLAIDIHSSTAPVVRQVASIDQVRYWASATVLADGRVLVNGGSNAENTLPAVYTTQIWNPTTETWTTGASATVPRLYHSIAMLLPDATVLTGGGGSPGPVTNLNAEIYYPPYLYKDDNSGNPAPRPTLVSAPTTATIGGTVAATVGNSDKIRRVTFIRTGSVTHSTNNDQRFIDAKFVQTSNTVTATLPDNVNLMLPGYYMMFVFSKKGTPSIAKIMLVTAP